MRYANLALAALLAVSCSTISCLAGREGGPGVEVTSVVAFGSDTYQVSFVSEQPASVCVRGDGHTVLRICVYDEYGNLICTNTDDGNGCVLAWTPRWTGSFTIQVENEGAVDNHYTIDTN